jgi:hypothetical protein
MYTRRQILLDGTLTVLIGSTICCTAHAYVGGNSEFGCSLQDDEAEDYFSRTNSAESYAVGNEDIEPRSGDPLLDRALVQSLAMMTRVFNVLPGFGFYDDYDGMNAKATSRQLLGQTDGTVLFGFRLLEDMLKIPVHPDAAVVAVCAHEFGHILSYKTGQIRDLAPDRSPNSTYRGEQYADYMAGYFAGNRKKNRPDFPAVVFANTQRSFGGGSHGSGVQRGDAVLEGFKASYQRNLDISSAISECFSYCMSRRL